MAPDNCSMDCVIPVKEEDVPISKGEDIERLVDKTHPVIRFRKKLQAILGENQKLFKGILLALLLIAYSVYLGFSIHFSLESATTLIVFTSIFVFFVIYGVLKHYLRDWVNNKVWSPIETGINSQWSWIRWLLFAVISIGVVLYLSLVVIKEAIQFQSLLGLVIFVLLAAVTSKHPDKIKWRPVLWGFGLQFVVGILVLRWEPGYRAVKFLSDEINKFLGYALEGSAAVFGDPWLILHPFLTVVVPLVVYLGSVMAMLFYLGLTQSFAAKIGWLMQITLGITAIEAFSLASNIFLSVLDTMLLLRVYIPKLTKSEFHTFLVGSHSTIAGFAYAIFVMFGVSPQHLVTGAVMSAPAAVAISKLNFPETEESILKTEEDMDLKNSQEVNVIEAGANGAWEAGKGVAAIMMQVIAFLGVFSFLNTTVAWFGERVGIEITISIILGYAFVPLSFLMGVNWAESKLVGELLGLKVVANELLANLELGRYVRENKITDRTAAIATYALCGFSSFGTLAIFVGVWNSVSKEKAKDAASQLPRVLMNANLACFLTACIAGLLYTDDVEKIGKEEPGEENPIVKLISALLNAIPGYKEILEWIT